MVGGGRGEGGQSTWRSTILHTRRTSQCPPLAPYINIMYELNLVTILINCFYFDCFDCIQLHTHVMDAGRHPARENNVIGFG